MVPKKRALVAGCGAMAQAWLKMFRETRPDVEVAGLVDLRPAAAEETAKTHGLSAPVFTDVKMALKKVRPDFLLDVTIPEAHAAATVAALKAGVPVLGEKPMAESMASARRMVKASEAAGKLYMVSQSRRYDARHFALRNAVRAGMIGAVASVDCDFHIGAHFGGFRDEMESPLILDMAIHHFDLCRFLTGLDPARVYAHEYNPPHSWYKGDVAASVIFEMANGAVFTYRGSWCAEGCPTSWNGDWRVQGEKGAIVMHGENPPRGQAVAPDAKMDFVRATVDLDVPVPTDVKGGIAGSCDEFLAALDGGAVPQGECRDNIKSLAMVFAAIESSRRKRRVEVKW